MVHERGLAVADAPVVAELLRACDIAVLGRWDFTMAELEADLRDDDLQHFGWYDDRDTDGGRLIAYGFIGGGGQSSKVQLDLYVHPDVADQALGVRLLTALEERGVTLAADRGHDHVVFDIGAYRQDERTRSRLRDRGFEVGTTFTRMRIDLDGPVPLPESPPGVVVLRAAADDRYLQTAHRILEKSFAEHYGHVPETFEEWRKKYAAHGPNWSQLWIAEVDERPAGALVGTAQFVEDENAGYVRSVGVLPEARGRGVARQMLLVYFAAAQEAGREAVLLHVDQANVTNALALYESVGMRAVLQIDAWTKTTPAGGPSV